MGGVAVISIETGDRGGYSECREFLKEFAKKEERNKAMSGGEVG